MGCIIIKDSESSEDVKSGIVKIQDVLYFYTVGKSFEAL